MITVKKAFTLPIEAVGKKFRVENNNLDLAPLLESSDLRVRLVSDVAFAHREERNRKETAQSLIKYVQISNIDVHLGRIRSYTSFKGADAPNNARRIMRSGDVLVSTRRPTRGAVAAVPKELDGEICTVFFTTLRIKDPDEVDPAFLALFLRTSLGRFQFQSLVTQTAYPVISDEDVESMVLLLPDIGIQRELVSRYESSVTAFFKFLNSAHQAVTDAQQDIENAVLGSHAETLIAPTFGVSFEAAEDSDEIPDTEDEA